MNTAVAQWTSIKRSYAYINAATIFVHLIVLKYTESEKKTIENRKICFAFDSDWIESLAFISNVK